jgi:hypothetical protein
MYDSNDKNQSVNNCEPVTKSWQDVAKQIINEPDYDKLGSLVQELCDILDKTPKHPTG